MDAIHLNRGIENCPKQRQFWGGRRRIQEKGKDLYSLYESRLVGFEGGGGREKFGNGDRGQSLEGST